MHPLLGSAGEEARLLMLLRARAGAGRGGAGRLGGGVTLKSAGGEPVRATCRTDGLFSQEDVLFSQERAVDPDYSELWEPAGSAADVASSTPVRQRQERSFCLR